MESFVFDKTGSFQLRFPQSNSGNITEQWSDLYSFNGVMIN